MALKGQIRLFGVLGVAFLASMAGFYLPSIVDGTRRSPKPVEIEFDSDRLLGLNQGAIVDQEFVCRNRSTRSWGIRKAHVSCSCLSLRADVAGWMIPVGEEISIPVRLEIGRAVGRNSVRLVLQLEDEFGERNHAEAWIEFESLPDFTYSPAFIEIDVEGDQPVSRHVQLRPVALPSLRIEQLASLTGALLLEEVPAFDQRGVSIRVTYQPSADPRHELSDVIMIRTNSSYMPFVQIPVVVRHSDRLAHWPRVLGFASEEGSLASIEVYGERGMRFAIGEIEGGGIVELHSQTECITNELFDGLRLVLGLDSSGGERMLPDMLRLKLRRESDAAVFIVDVPIVLFQYRR